MPKGKVVYVSTSDSSKWSVKGEGARKSLKNFENKKDAVYFGRQVAKNAGFGQLKIQKRERKFQAEYTYGNNPFPPEG